MLGGKAGAWALGFAPGIPLLGLLWEVSVQWQENLELRPFPYVLLLADVIKGLEF